MRKVKGTRYKLEVRDSPIHGQGLFAAEDIPWGKKIKQYRGQIISNKEATKRAAKGATAIMELGVNKNIDGFDKGNGAASSITVGQTPTVSCCVRRRRCGWWQE